MKAHALLPHFLWTCLTRKDMQLCLPVKPSGLHHILCCYCINRAASSRFTCCAQMLPFLSAACFRLPQHLPFATAPLLVRRSYTVSYTNYVKFNKLQQNKCPCNDNYILSAIRHQLCWGSKIGPFRTMRQKCLHKIKSTCSTSIQCITLSL